MPRYKITIDYDGRPFVGWQRQDNGPTAQGVIERAIKSFTGETVTIGGAGRTDSGVHATGQVAHLDLAKDWPAETVKNALNFHTQPDPVAILACEKAGLGFDARFSAIRRHYRFKIANRLEPLTHDLGLAWHVKPELDAEAMNDAAQVLLGHHDFTTFRHTRCQAKSPWKTMERICVYRQGYHVFLECSSRSFLHNQVRSMVGSLRLVGEGRWTKDDLRAALEACDRQACGPVAVPEGLYLTQVDYRTPKEDEASFLAYQDSLKSVGADEAPADEED
ncbi:MULTISPECIES: tRNA pseudouridine(38-40) synthase TruA [unclassified Pseudovibrio]|uniref:tRNA pseudouridine(38-40) synthase TruA n=1 Tax=unclassified Pseudovibrio TaxID=2627060 RepID=UPI0007AE44EE|nr:MULTISPECIES: tRNA pseudouridine(38-40) synthase TruA [unclassified Pseudovibrio]KZL23778.1 tRNA pseudouridine synthase A [Pseudovibrio sp. WM33]KZL28191.1 tRNA pseudouridine synthase A [Pseudovibrio sp. Ad37]